MMLITSAYSKAQACSSLQARSAAAARPCAVAKPAFRQRMHIVRASTASEGSSDNDEQAGLSAASSSSATASAAVAIKTKAAADASPFLDPLVRSLILGVGAGILCETSHVLFKAWSLASSGSLPIPFSVGALQQFAPNFFADHAVAIGMWLLLYSIEAATIASVMAGDPNKPFTELSTQLQGLPLLPRKLFPQSLAPVKDAVAHTLAVAAKGESSASNAAAAAILSAATAGNLAEAQAAAAAAPATITAAPPGLSKKLEKTLDDIEAAAAGRSNGGAVEAPAKPRSPKPQGPIKPKEGLKRSKGLAGREQQQQQQEAEDGLAGRRLSRRDKELADRKSYLKNFWYAAALSSNVGPDKPLGVDILGSRISLFRDHDGKVVAVDDTCPHRGAPLSEGWTATDKATGKKCLVCPYHGWAFDSTGRLRDVPSAESGSWPQRPLLGSYVVEERGGFVWLFYGSPALPAEERPPIPFTPELEQPGWRAVYGEIEFDCGHWGVFENAIDMAHIHYLHADSFGNSEKPKVMSMTSTRDTFETSCSFRIHNKPMNKLWEWTAVPSVPVTAKAMLPSTSAVNIELAHGVKMITFVNTVPISENRAINRFCLIRNFALNPTFDFMARNNMYKILGEDKVMVDKLAPHRLEQEYSLAPDMPQIAFRQLRQEWIDMGYGVPSEVQLPRRGLLPPGI